MKFLLDAHLSRKLITYLAGHGHDAVHVASLLNGFASSDAEISAQADAEGRVVVSKDADFVNMHAVSGTPAKLLMVKIGNSSNSELITLLDRYLDDIVAGFAHANYIELHRALLVIHSATEK